MRSYSRLPLIAVLFALWIAADPAAAAEASGPYLGLGLRGLARDPTSVAMASKFTLFAGELYEDHETTLSVRPKLLYGEYFEARLPVVVELAVTTRFYPFIGIGAAYNTDDFGHVDHMYTFGSDFELKRKITASIVCNLIYQDQVPDRDTEIIVSLNLEY